MWQNEKKSKVAQLRLERQQHTQELLNQVEKAHLNFYADKDESEKNFKEWLVNQINCTDRVEQASHSNETNHDKESIMQLKSVSKLFSVSAPSSTTFSSKQDALRPLKLKPLDNQAWNFSTKPHDKEYIANLTDFYPRDPYTCLPADSDLVYLNKELKGMSIDQVQALMKKKLNRCNSAIEPSQRTVLFKPKHIIDAQTKSKIAESTGPVDQAGLHIYSGDPESFPYREAKRFVSDAAATRKYISHSYGDYHNTAATVKQIKRQLLANGVANRKVKDDKLEVVEKCYGHELSDYMKDRHNKMSQKYEKVYIC